MPETTGKPAPVGQVSPLGLTSQEFLALALSEHRVHTPVGIGAYRDFFRTGRTGVPWVNGSVPGVLRQLREDSSEGEVVKFTTGVPGVEIPGKVGLETLEIESVLIPMISSSGGQSYTLCVSSQVGCAMGCTFCETAQMGLIRSLTPGEIVAQWWNAAHVIGIRPKNIVFMGMGEPMDNLEAVIQAVAVLKDHNGPHVAISAITISTVGRVDGIRRLADKVQEHGWHRLGLALSLNAPNDADRSAIMPVNRKWNLAAVQEALLEWPRRTGNKVCVEYVLIPTVNDTPKHADEITEFIRPFGLLQDGRIGGQSLSAVLNLIPYNPRRNSPWPAPTEASVAEFLRMLIDRGVFAKRRRTKGRQMMGACGQLGTESIRARKVVQVTVQK